MSPMNICKRYSFLGLTKNSLTPARESESSFGQIKNVSLDNIFCRKERRKINPGNVFSYGGEKYLIPEQRDYRFRTISINTHQDMTMSYDIAGKEVTVTPFESTKLAA